MAAQKPTVDVACPKCGKGDFDIVERQIPRGADDTYLVGFVRCTGCKSAVGVLDAELVERVELLGQQED
jgi:DNA-directed RNA polymerase subunit M/transcription elongation factor TFIIS